MLKNQLNKSIRSLSNSKKKNTQIMKNHPKIFQIYEGDKKQNNKNASNKKIAGCGKVNISKSSRNNSSTYQFPQFSIKYEESCHRGVINKTKRSMKSDKKEVESFLIYQKDTQDMKKNVKSNAKASQKHCQNVKKPLVKKDESYLNYQEAIRKIFKALDIFNRGQISEININKWVPQSALFFLGKIFQKIKQFKLTLTEAQFINLSKPLFDESSGQDIKWFINQVNIKDNMLKVSIDMNDSMKKEELSPIKMRMMNEEMQASKDRIVSNTKNSHLNQVMELINDRQKQTLQKLRIVKQKQKTTPFNILGEINGNQYMIKYRNQVEALKTKGKYANKQISQSYCNEQKLSSSHFKKSIQKASPSYSINKRDYQKQNCEVPNFTLELPQQINTSANVFALTKTIKTDQQFLEQKKDSIVVEKYSNLNQQRPSVNINANSRYRKESFGEVKRAIVSDENQRLDKLSNKLQEYIKLNRAKIQNNLDFIRSNSGPKI